MNQRVQWNEWMKECWNYCIKWMNEWQNAMNEWDDVVRWIRWMNEKVERGNEIRLLNDMDDWCGWMM